MTNGTIIHYGNKKVKNRLIVFKYVTKIETYNPTCKEKVTNDDTNDTPDLEMQQQTMEQPTTLLIQKCINKQWNIIH